jgi:hypothetical protein
MMEMDYRRQIESALGRTLRSEELVRVGSLAQLTAAQLRVAENLALKQLVLCALYLRSIAPVGVGEASSFIDSLLTKD